MLQACAANSLFPAWGTFAFKRKNLKDSNSIQDPDQHGNKRRATISVQPFSSSGPFTSSSNTDQPEISVSFKNDYSNPKRKTRIGKAKANNKNIIRIKQENDSEVEDDVEMIENDILTSKDSSGAFKKRSEEFPLVTRIPVGGEKFIASVLTTASEDTTFPAITNGKGGKEIDISGTVIEKEDKVIQLSGDHTYFEFMSPRKKVILKITKNPEKPVDKVKSLEQLIDILNRENLLNPEARSMMEAFMDLPEGLVKNRTNSRVSRPYMKFTKTVQKFACTLYFYAPKAYEYTSKIFVLPDPASIRTSIKVSSYLPGFTKEALTMLNDGFCNASRQENMCSIMILNVRIREQRNINSHEEMTGSVDFGCGQNFDDSDELPLATNALLFVAVGLASQWKIPFGYFLNDGLSGELLSSLVSEAITLLEANNLKVRTLICEGQGAFLSLGKILGCRINVKSFKDLETSFPHPSDGERRIHLIFSASHSLRLLKNLLADKGSLQSTTYGKIEWKYLKMLMEGSDREYADESEFAKQKMKIRLGCHSLGCSLGKVLELYHNKDQGEFAGCESTCDFAADLDRAFDTLNSSNPVVPGEKSPMYQYTVEEQKESLIFAARRVMGLETMSGKRLVDEGRRLSVILFSFTLKAVTQLAAELVNRNIIRYLCTNRLNLDHAEVVLSCLQRIGNWHNNPSASEFRSAYKKLLTKANTVFRVNSIYTNDFEGNGITVGQGMIYANSNYFGRQDLIFENLFICKSPHVDYEAEIMYTAKNLVYHVAKKLSCSGCIEILLDDYESKLVDSKCQIYIRPSRYVQKLIRISEKCLKLHSQQPLQIEQVVTVVFNEYSLLVSMLGVKESIIEHYLEEPNHVICLTKVMIRTFLSLRLRNYYKILERIKIR